MGARLTAGPVPRSRFYAPGVPTEHRVRRWARDAQLDWPTGGLAAAFVVLRLVATTDRPIAVFNDTASYFNSRVWGGVRFPVVTTLYALVGDQRALVTIQAVAGAIAWVAAAVVAGSVLTRRGARYAFVGALFVLGLTPPVTRVDNALLSESVAISLTVVLVACVLRFACRPTQASALATFAVAALWALTRQSNALMLGVAAVLLVVLGAGRTDRRLAWGLAGGLVAVAAIGGLLATSSTQIQEYNTAQILVRRVLLDEARSRWFVGHGMPGKGRALLAPPYENRFGDPAVELQEDPRFGSWLRADATPTYLRYLVTHPGFTVTTPFSDDGAVRAFAVGTDGYGSARAVVPRAVVTVAWPIAGDDQTVLGTLVAGILLVGAVVAVRSPSRRRAFAGAGGVVLVGAATVVMVTHSAGWEYERLLVPTGVAVRMALLWLLAALWGDVSVAPASGWRAGAPRRRDGSRSAAAAPRAPRTAPDPDAGGSPGAPAADPGSGPPGTS